MSFTGASVVADGRRARSQPGSVITVEDASHGYHLLIVEGYSRTKSTPTGESFRSRPFMVGGYLWCIYYYPNGDELENAEFISFSVGLLHNCVALAKPLKLQLQISFVDQIDGGESSRIHASKVIEFPVSRARMVYQRFVKREALEKSEYLKDDSFAIRYDIVVLVEDVDSLEDAATSSRSTVVPPSSMPQQFSNLLLSEEGTDVTFEVSGEAIAAHRCVLAARSAVFKALLFGAMKEGMETKSLIQVDGMDAKVFRAMLSFIYSDLPPEIEDEKEDPNVMWQHLLIAADRYDLGRLRLMCEEKLCEYLDVSTVSTILTLAEQHNCRGLKAACLEFLDSPVNLQKVVAMGGLDSLATGYPSLLKDLIAKLASPKQDKVVQVYPSTSYYVKLVFHKCCQSCPSVIKDLIAKLDSFYSYCKRSIMQEE